VIGTKNDSLQDKLAEIAGACGCWDGDWIAFDCEGSQPATRRSSFTRSVLWLLRIGWLAREITSCCITIARIAKAELKR